jgi:hypothetical protein
MADTRINALSTATSSVSDDFVPIDGTTNGTRKLSAFSPSFGGNATVGGTLTVSGTGTSTFAGGVTIRRDQAALTGLIVDNRNGGGTSDLILSEDGGSSNYFRIYRSGSTTGTPNVVNISNIVGGSATTTAIEFGSPLKATATTASTSTSSGALVVSGGVGVAGAIYGGGVINTSVGTGGVGNQLVLNNSATNATSGRGSAIVYTGTGDANLAAIESQTATASNNTGKLIIKTSNAGTLAVAATYDENGNLIQKVNGTAPSLAVNSTMTFELTSNTSLKIFVRGSDGTTRSTTLTLA